ncbi:hypothetical protein [Thermomonas sp.]|jgi:hypothetical protein|uniref:hypothetical protein n=1 Tax=Thermomonas sp. TaxID=1971895 RepID=UPI001B51FDF9|nr:hypothetical protein [Thermomonas sp.]MBK6925735.1 hypothetical protein [Thermomonas sp.]MBK7206085.1 hypothetical protein [Thermomonas sp.]MBK9670464.1 hypothetical protein [Thermomonas sp.]MBL0228410.1 hypothetical protein [Thermomonas sp.]MBP6438628.1 hypothetical protein [Thermomonas sp.]
MNPYLAFKLVHIALGCVALVAFWTAGIARKGGPLHVGAGKVYLLAMAGLLAATVPMCWLAWFAGHQKIVVFLLYLLVITCTSTWLSWRAIRDRRDWARYVGPAYRALMWLNLGAGAGIALFGLFVADRMQLIIVSFSLIGISTFASMRRFALQPPTEARWWMRQHLRAMLGNGVATHIAFLSIGLPRLLPMLQGPVFQNLAWLAPLGVAAVAGVYLGRKYLGAPGRAGRLPQRA